MDFKVWIESTLLPATPENINRAKQFLFQKWKERAKELGRPEPLDLSNACKFSSLFMQKVFGGELQGNWHHQYLILPTGEKIDPTDAVGVDSPNPYAHDPKFWGNREHKASMQSCLPRVEGWVREFLML